jgi:hypothetical protein
MSPGEESARPEITVLLIPHYDDRLPAVVPVVPPVVVGAGRRYREYRKQSGKRQNHDFFHFCSSNFSLMEISEDFSFGFPT